MRKILVISNRCFSFTDNNGKTLLSLFENIPSDNVSQLFFYGNTPTISGYEYFQISDRDILNGLFNKRKRGRRVQAKNNTFIEDVTLTNKYHVKRTALLLWLRYFLWKNSWISPQLIKWLNEIKPEDIFFMAGDSLYAYEVCSWIKENYGCRLYTYVTDDYILKREKENVFEKSYRKKVLNALKKAVNSSECFFTICERMRNTYNRILSRDSSILYNRCESLYDCDISSISESNEEIVFLYAGSIYYGRDSVLIELCNVLDRINKENNGKTKRAVLHVYCNQNPGKDFINELEKGKVGIYKGSVDKNELKSRLNLCNYPVFVESFEKEQIEKVKLSFSTKIPEYLSLRKTILAIGPKGIGSMDCLEKSAVCVNNPKDLYNVLSELIIGTDFASSYAEKAYLEFKKLCSMSRLRDYLGA